MIGAGGLFPEGWSFARDVLVFVGRGAEPWLPRLLEAGQRRIFFYLPEGASRAGLVGPAEVVHTPSGLFDAILGLRGPLPARVVVRRQPDPWASEELHLELKSTVEDAMRFKRMLVTTIQEFGPTWLQQGIAALPDVASHASISALEQAFAKRPCFIVSPGPSLERNVAELRRVQGRALVMTCTHALKVLERYGVVPDLVVAADAGGDLLRHYEGVDTAEVGALVIGASCARAHWQRPARTKLAFASNGELDQWIFEPFGDRPNLPSGGSVACSELSLALRMGCDPIVFVGQDLAYTDGRAYSPSNVDGAARLKASADGHSFYLVKPPGSPAAGAPDADGDLRATRTQQLLKVPGYHGGLVLTSGSFYAFLKWFEITARSLEGRVMLVNSTEGGANIRGMQHRPLADAIATYVREPFPITEVLAERARVADVEGRRAAAGRFLERILLDLERCQDLVTQCQVLAHQARRDTTRLGRLQETETELVQALRPMRFLSLLAQGEITSAQERVLSATTLEENLSAAESLFGVVQKACETLRAPLRSACAELR